MTTTSESPPSNIATCTPLINPSHITTTSDIFHHRHHHHHQQQQDQRSGAMVTLHASILQKQLLLGKKSSPKKQKKIYHEDPMSHRIIEKRRRDRMNNCLADLSHLIPSGYLKKGRGRIEKTEIIEMAIKYMNHLQNHSVGAKSESCELDSSSSGGEDRGSTMDNYRLGYQECLSETMHFLVEVEGFYAGDSLCVRLLNHLQKHCDKLIKGGRFGQPRSLNNETSSSSGYNANGSSSSCSDGNGKDSGISHCQGDWRMTLANSVSENESGGVDHMPLSLAVHSIASTPSVPEASSVEHGGLLDVAADGSRSPLHGLTSECGPSQLREMLQSPALPVMTPFPGNGLGQDKSRSCSTRSSSDDAGTLYKFKTNIKQRFNADLEHHYDAPSHQEKRRRVELGDSEERLSIVSSDYQASSLQPLERRNSDCDSPPSPTPPLQHSYPNMLSQYSTKHHSQPPYNSHQTPSAPEPTSANQPSSQGQVVPIFALHTKGSYYIPLTLDLSILAPLMSNSSDHSPVLHPVTISVNFCSPAQSVEKPERTLGFHSWHVPHGERDTKESDRRGDVCSTFSSSAPPQHARWNCITERVCN